MLKIRSWAVVLAFVISVASSGVGHSEEHSPAKITGSQIELFERGHAFAGNILNVPVYGVFNEHPFGAHVEFRKEGSSVVLNLINSEKGYAGDMIETQSAGGHTGQPREKITHIEYANVEKTGKTEGLITLKMNSDVILVKVSAPTFERNHFQGPHFEANMPGLDSSKKVEFSFTGEACFGYSTNLAMMILGSYYHLSR